MTIEKIGIEACDTLVALFARVVDGMRSQGIDQWDERYPDRAVLEADLRAGVAFALFGDREESPRFQAGAPVGYVALNEEQSEEYRDVPWLENGGAPLVIHRLCVDPVFQGRGAAKTLLSFAETFALQTGHTSIRLDAFTQNPAALALYDSLGYDWRGEVTFRKGLFRCYEKILSPGELRFS